MNITVFGASGKTGRIVVRLLLESGYTVTAFVHSQVPFDNHPNLRVLKGTIYDADEVAQALAGSGGVISALGSWGTPRKDILSSAMQRIIPAMQAAGISRIVSLTGTDSRAAGDHLGLWHRLTHTLLKLVGGKVLADAERHISLLEVSGLSWTVVRSPIMLPFGGRAFRLVRQRPFPWATIPRAAVAQSLVSELTDPDYNRQCPYLRRG